MQTLIIVNGKPRSGKDSFVDFCVAELAVLGVLAKKGSSIDAVKEAAMVLGWDGIKDSKGRKFLSDLKDMSAQQYDGPMQYLRGIMKETTAKVLFLFIREPDEIRKFVAEFPRAFTVLVKGGMAEDHDNHADRNTHLYPYRITICNEGTLASLRDHARAMVNTIIF